MQCKSSIWYGMMDPQLQRQYVHVTKSYIDGRLFGVKLQDFYRIELKSIPARIPQGEFWAQYCTYCMPAICLTHIVQWLLCLLMILQYWQQGADSGDPKKLQKATNKVNLCTNRQILKLNETKSTFVNFTNKQKIF